MSANSRCDETSADLHQNDQELEVPDHQVMRSTVPPQIPQHKVGIVSVVQDQKPVKHAQGMKLHELPVPKLYPPPFSSRVKAQSLDHSIESSPQFSPPRNVSPFGESPSSAASSPIRRKPIPAPLPIPPLGSPESCSPISIAIDFSPRKDRDSLKDLDLYDSSDESVSSKLHYGPAPDEKQPRRLLNIRKRLVQLTKGHLVIDNPIPKKLASIIRYREEREFSTMRYTAITCDADDVPKHGYFLRQNINARDTELFVSITMYNENEKLLARSLHGLMKNIAYLCSRTKSRVWGKDGWKKVVVSIFTDGRKKVNPQTLNILAALGIYQEGVAKSSINGVKVQAHIYEYTTQISIDPDMKYNGAEKGIVPVQLIFCIKENNCGKINSHRWFFNAFCPMLNPNICVLLDVGTCPSLKSLYHFWKAFDKNSNVAGACGEIIAMKGSYWKELMNPLVAAQNFEYKISNILDKPFESLFGFISVLPGAFSAYRYIALKPHEDGTGPLASYFKGELLKGSDTDIFSANMYLAEDRILCWELVSKRGHKWILKYVKSAKGETDVPESIAELICQRRRWLNGSFFAAIYAQCHILNIQHTDHSLIRRIALGIQFLYQFFNLVLSFFALSCFYLIINYLTKSIAIPEIDPFGHNIGYVFHQIFNYFTLLLITVQFLISMGNRPQGSKCFYLASIIFSAIIMVYCIFSAIYLLIIPIKHIVEAKQSFLNNTTITNIAIALLSTHGSYFLASLFYLDPWHMFTSFFQYLLLLPFYNWTMQIYAFCNTHDISWGTKGETKFTTDLGNAECIEDDVVEVEMPAEQIDIDTGYLMAVKNLRETAEYTSKDSNIKSLKDYYREIRTAIVSVWMISNALFAIIIMKLMDNAKTNYFLISKYRPLFPDLLVLTWMIAVLSFVRMAGSFIYLIVDTVQKLRK